MSMTDTAPEAVLAHKKNVRKAHWASMTRLMNQAERVLSTSVDTDGLTVTQTSFSKDHSLCLEQFPQTSKDYSLCLEGSEILQG